ncbi:MAG: hypothetical protein ABH836_07575 [Candidatus Omnitrophota bacterium]
MTNDKFKEMIDKFWPATKTELEKAMKKTKKALQQGEKYLKEVSEKGVQETKKMSLHVKKEKLCYDLGKIVAKTPKTKWQSDAKITDLIREIKELGKEIKSI